MIYSNPKRERPLYLPKLRTCNDSSASAEINPLLICMCYLDLLGTFWPCFACLYLKHPQTFRQVSDLKSNLEDIRFGHRDDVKVLQKKNQEPWNVVDLFWPNQRLEKWHCTPLFCMCSFDYFVHLHVLFLHIIAVYVGFSGASCFLRHSVCT